MLGPLSVDGAEKLAPRDRVVLAALAVRPHQPISAERLADALWGEDPPATWAKVVQGSVVRIRKVLGVEAVRTTDHGYVLTLPDDEIDAALFERQVRRGRELLALGEAEHSEFTLTQALALWHGDALAELKNWDAGAAAGERLEELRRDAEELRVEAALQTGNWREVLPEAAALVTEQPLREQRWALLARARYQAGHQGEALATLQRARTVLVTELGLDPGPELVAVEQAILQQDPLLLPTRDGTAASATCPYPGLRPYDIVDTENFFGRADEVAECRALLDRQGVLAVVGPSGCGKSSLVRAGIASGLQRHDRQVAVMTPGLHPMGALTDAAVLRTSTVLVVDQLEEVTTVCRDDRERHEFLDAVVAHAESDAAVVLTLRADQLGLLTAHRGAARMLERGLHLLGAMSEADLRAAIEGPARQAGLMLEPGLVDLLVEEATGEPGALPLLSHALAQTWENREGRTLTVAGYRATGGIRGAVTQSAERLFQGLPPARQQALRDLLLRLVTATPDGQAVRSPVSRRVVTGNSSLEALVELLVGARLVTGDGDVVELAHESLVGAWPRLRSWLDEDLEGQQILRHLTVAADSWEAMGRPSSELYRGTRLARALDWRDHTTAELAPFEQAFLDSGRDLAEAEQRSAEQRLIEQKRANRRLRGLLGGMVALLVMVVIAGALAVGEGRRADTQARVAQVRELAAASRAAISTDPELAILLALRATALSTEGSGAPAREAIEALHTAVLASRVHLVVEDLGGSVAWSPRGDVFVTEGPEDTGVVDLRDASTGASVLSFVGHEVDINEVAFSPDGLLATTGDDGALRVWDPEDGSLVSEVLGTGSVFGPSFSPDSSRLSAAWTDEDVVRIVDVSAGEALVEAKVSAAPRSTSFSADGGSVAVATFSPSNARVLDATTGAVSRFLVGPDAPGSVLGHSPDGSWVATAGDDGTVHVRDTRTGETVHLLTDVGSAVSALTWAADSRRLAVAGVDGKVSDFDVTASRADMVLALAGGAAATLAGLAFSPDGTHLLGGDEVSGAATVWDVGRGGDAEVANVPTNKGDWSDSAFVGDGRLATTTDRGTVTVWDTGDGTVLTRLEPASRRWSKGPRRIAVSPDGSMLAAGEGSWAAVWDLASGAELFSKSLGDWTSRPSYSPDSTLLALAGDGKTVGLWKRDGTLAALLFADPGSWLQEPTFSPDGSTVAVAQVRSAINSATFELLLWDWQSDTTEVLEGAEGDLPVYSPDGKRLALVVPAGRVEVWDVDSAEHLLTLEGHTGSVTDVAFSPDGSLLATASFDGTIRLWSSTTGAAVLRLPRLPGEVSNVAFSPDGRHLATGSSAEGLTRVWALDHTELVSIAHDNVKRTLTDAECEEYLHTRGCPES